MSIAIVPFVALYLGWLLKDLEPRQILNLGDPDDV